MGKQLDKIKKIVADAEAARAEQRMAELKAVVPAKPPTGYVVMGLKETKEFVDSVAPTSETLAEYVVKRNAAAVEDTMRTVVVTCDGKGGVRTSDVSGTLPPDTTVTVSRGAVKPQAPTPKSEKPHEPTDQQLGRFPDQSIVTGVYNAGLWEMNIDIPVDGSHGLRVIGSEADGIHFALKLLWKKYVAQEAEGRSDEPVRPDR